MTNHAAAKVGLKQETIAIVAVGLTILGTLLFTTTRLEARIDRIQDEARADREAFAQEGARFRSEARADREAFSREILRLTAGHARLEGVVEGPRTE